MLVRAVLLISMVSLGLSGCGGGGLARAVTTTGSGFDRAACLSDEAKTGKKCDQSQFTP